MHNRQEAQLRGKTRDILDKFLLTTLAGTGIGRSAFICAAVELIQQKSEDEPEEFVSFTDKAKLIEMELRRQAPDEIYRERLS